MSYNVMLFICPVNNNVWHKESQDQVTKLNTKRTLLFFTDFGK